MKPSREFDILVAEKVMGWTGIERNKHSHISGTQVTGYDLTVEPSPHTGARPRYTVPKYSTDIKAAWEVVSKMKEYYFIIETDHGAPSHWICQFTDSKSVGETAPHAICLAALKAMGVDLNS